MTKRQLGSNLQQPMVQSSVTNCDPLFVHSFGSSSAMEDEDLPPLVGEDGEELSEPSQASSRREDVADAAASAANAST